MYNFKTIPELAWFVLTVVVTTLAQYVQGAPPDDWKVWATSVIAALTRALIGAALDFADKYQTGD